MTPESIRATTADHLDKMDTAIRAAGITPDEPLAPVLAEWRRSLAWAGELTAELRVAAERAGDPSAPAQPLDEAAIARLAQVAGTAADMKAASIIRAHNRRTILTASAVLVGALLIGAAGGYWAGRRSQLVIEAGIAAEAFRDGPDAAASWLGLMRANSPASIMGECTGKAVVMVGTRRACGVALWLDPVENGSPPVKPSGK